MNKTKDRDKVSVNAESEYESPEWKRVDFSFDVLCEDCTVDADCEGYCESQDCYVYDCYSNECDCGECD